MKKREKKQKQKQKEREKEKEREREMEKMEKKMKMKMMKKKEEREKKHTICPHTSPIQRCTKLFMESNVIFRKSENQRLLIRERQIKRE